MTYDRKKKISEEMRDHPMNNLDDDLEDDKYSLEEYGFQVGYYGDEEE
ncbi:MAG TPA: hypothetical protein VFE88_01835 [Candidatus Nanoarchaeia archaeon]|nr:hypothetical protein [Candidatus Nanoarchaeia archaeon]